MKPREYKTRIKQLDLTQEQAGKFFGVSNRTARRWISGETAIPVSVAYNLRVMEVEDLTPFQFKIRYS